VLQEARRQACLAIDFYNRAGDKRSFNDFVVHMHLAWQSLLHAELERRKVDYAYRDRRGRYVRGKDGEKRTWELERCLKERYKSDDPMRLNVEFFIGLRNQIEHRFQDALIVATAAEAHAYVLNFERELVDLFGERESLARELRFPIFVQSLSPAGMDEQRRLRRALPAAARSYISRFEAKLAPGVTEDERYAYRVQLTPMKGSKTEADLAVTFVPTSELTAEELAAMEQRARNGTVLIAEKQRSVMYKDELLPAAAARAIEDAIPFVFRVHHFTHLRKTHRITPAKDEPRHKTDTRYCVYNEPYDNYLYTPAYNRRIVDLIGTREGWIATFGGPPELKVTQLAAASSMKTNERKDRSGESGKPATA
jgi:hypothetical protein